MLAIELSTSSDWAREMRGTASIASTVIGRGGQRLDQVGVAAPGLSRPISVAPSRSRAISSADGALTRSTTSACHASSAVPTRAPASAYASSGKLLAAPAPASTTTS